MFTGKHFIWLALCAVGIFGGLLLARRRTIPTKQAARIAAVICALSEGCKIATHMLPSPFGGYALDPLALPFHLCSMQIFVILYIAFAEDSPTKDKVVSFFVPSALLGGFSALLIPVDGVDFLDCLAYQGFVYHAMLCWLSLYLLLGGKADLGKQAWLRNLLILGGLGIGAIYINGAFFDYGTNFLFVVRPPLENLPVLNLNHGWYVYFLTLAGLGIFLMTAFHLPFLIAERKKTGGKTC